MKNLIIIFLGVILTSCGFKVVERSTFDNFSISNVITEGDKRINFNLKNKLSFASSENEKN